MIRGVVLPYSRAGIAAALILGLGRAVGEAIAVTQVIGNTTDISFNLFDTGDTLASKIASSYNSADTDLFRSSLVYLAVLLLVFSLVINVAGAGDRPPRRPPPAGAHVSTQAEPQHSAHERTAPAAQGDEPASWRRSRRSRPSWPSACS